MVKGFSMVQEYNTDMLGRISPLLVERPLGNRDLSGVVVPYVRCNGCYAPRSRLARTKISAVQHSQAYAELEVE